MRRGHRFCRYADDCNIYVRSPRAGERVMASVCHFLTANLHLKVNESKSAVAHPEERAFLGFSISKERAAHRAKGTQAFQDACAGTHLSDTKYQSGSTDSTPVAIPDRMARLLSIVPDPSYAPEPGRVDPPEVTHVYLAAVAEREKSVQTVAPAGPFPVRRGSGRRITNWTLAHVEPSSRSASSAQR